MKSKMKKLIKLLGCLILVCVSLMIVLVIFLAVSSSGWRKLLSKPSTCVGFFIHDRDRKERMRALDRADSIVPKVKLKFGYEDYTIPKKDPDGEIMNSLGYPATLYEREPFKKIWFLRESLKSEAVPPLLEVFLDELRHDKVRWAAITAVKHIMSHIYFSDPNTFNNELLPIVIPDLRRYMDNVKVEDSWISSDKPGTLSKNLLISVPFNILYNFDPDKSFIIEIIKKEIDKNENAAILILLNNARLDLQSPPPQEIIELNRSCLSSPNSRIRYEAAINEISFGDKTLGMDTLYKLALSNSVDCKMRWTSYRSYWKRMPKSEIEKKQDLEMVFSIHEQCPKNE